jgi:hypothetical protein
MTSKADGWSSLAFLPEVTARGGTRSLTKPIAQAAWDYVEVVFNRGDEYYVGSAARGNNIRFNLPEGDGYKAVMLLGIGNGNRLLGIGVPSESDENINKGSGSDGAGGINIKTDTKTMTFTMIALTADIVGTPGNLTIANKNKPDGAITINGTDDIPYFILAEALYVSPTDIPGTFSIDGFPADVGGLSANGLVGVVGGAVVDTISTLISSEETAIPPLLVTPKDKTATIGGGKVNIGFTLTTSAAAGFNWGFSRLWFDVTVQAFASGGTASGDYKYGSEWHVSNGLDASYDRGAGEDSAGRDILFYIGDPTKIGDSGSEELMTLEGPLDLTYKVLAPVTGGSPVTSFFAGTYSGTVVWKRTGETVPYSGLFEAGTDYTATITLYPMAGYVFPTAPDSVAITHTGATDPAVGAYTFTVESNGTATGDIEFPAVGSVMVQKVTDTDLTYKVPAPVTGGTPVTYFNAPQYTENVKWKKTVGDTELDGLFAANTAYTAEVTLTAASGWTLDGVTTFTHGDGSVSYNTSTKVATITFSATTAVTVQKVTDTDLTYKVPTPVTYFNAPQYTGNVEWKETVGSTALVGLFEAGTAYAATVTLTAASGRTLDGVTTFTHDDGTVSYNMSTKVATIEFPQTVAGTSANVGQFTDPFSGEAGKEDSFIDMIRKAKYAGRTYQVIVMPFVFPTERVNLSASGRDITGGLELTTANITLDGGAE